MSDHVPRKIGGSEKPHQHFVQCNSKADARERARSHSRGRSPIHHTAHEVGQKNHYHPANKDGEKYADGSHYEYGKPKQVNDKEKKQQNKKN